MEHSSKIRTAGRPRIHLMDEIRGFCVLCMLFYHAFYLADALFEWAWGKTLLYFFMPAEPVFAAAFIVVSGISSQLSRSNVYRGLKLAVVAVLITVCTVLMVPEEGIWFGILHLLSVCMILYGLTKRAIDRVPFALGMIVCAVWFLFTWGLAQAKP